MSANPPQYMSPYNEGDYRARVHVIQKALESAYRNGKYDPDVARALDEEKYWAYTNRKTHQLITINWDPNFCDFSIMNQLFPRSGCMSGIMSGNLSMKRRVFPPACTPTHQKSETSFTSDQRDCLHSRCCK